MSHILDKIKKDIKRTDKVIDFGCDDGLDLFSFHDFGFKILIGLDTNEELKYFIFKKFVQYKYEMDENGFADTRPKDRIVDLRKRYPKYWDEFDCCFSFIFDKKAGNILNYNFGEEKYDFIIASRLLHFFDRGRAEDQIERLYDSLNTNGIFYFSVNTLDKTKKGLEKGWIIERNSSGEYIGYNSEKPSNLWYLYDDLKLNYLQSKYKTLKSVSNDRSSEGQFVIIKN